MAFRRHRLHFAHTSPAIRPRFSKQYAFLTFTGGDVSRETEEQGDVSLQVTRGVDCRKCIIVGLPVPGFFKVWKRE